jgi:hypothetical protein
VALEAVAPGTLDVAPGEATAEPESSQGPAAQSIVQCAIELTLAAESPAVRLSLVVALVTTKDDTEIGQANRVEMPGNTHIPDFLVGVVEVACIIPRYPR